MKECWYNAKGKGKGAQQKGGVRAVSDDTASQLSAGPSVSVAGSTATTAATTKPGVRHISDQKMRILAVSGERQGYLLVDTGATVSVCRPETFLEPVNTAARQTLYSVDDTPLDTKGTVEPVLKLGRRSRQEAKTTFQVVSGITDDILSVNRAVDAGARVVFDAAGSYIEWEDGSRADFIRSGRQFLMPYTCARRPHKRARVAAVGEEEHYNTLTTRRPRQSRTSRERKPPQRKRDESSQRIRVEAWRADRRRTEPVTESVPVEPTEEDKERHRLTHLPFQAWCPECVQGAGRGGMHRRKADTGEKGLEAVVQMDYTFYSRGAQQRQAPEDESILVTVLTLVDRDTGWPCSVQVPKKGAECGNFVLDTVEQYLNTLGHSRVTLQIDSEGSLRSVATAKVKVRESPPYSHQSQGAVEGEHSFLAGLVRTWLMDLQNRYPNCGVDVNHTVLPWLVKYAAWSVARFQVKTTDKMTPYKIVNGVEYLSSICRFGETVMAKLPKPGTKAQRRWIRGLWVGKLDRDNTNIILTECGALSVRSVRRLPAEAQANRTLMGSAAGVPWALRQGRVLREPPPMVACCQLRRSSQLRSKGRKSTRSWRDQPSCQPWRTKANHAAWTRKLRTWKLQPSLRTS